MITGIKALRAYLISHCGRKNWNIQSGSLRQGPILPNNNDSLDGISTTKTRTVWDINYGTPVSIGQNRSNSAQLNTIRLGPNTGFPVNNQFMPVKTGAPIGASFASYLAVQRRKMAVIWFLLFGFIFIGCNSLFAAVEKSPLITTTLHLQKPTIKIPKEYSSLLIQGCMWEGEVMLNGSRYVLGALGDQRSQQPTGNSIFQFFLQPLATKTPDSSPFWMFSPPSNLFFDGHSYKFQWAFEGTSSDAVLKLTFQEEPHKLAELKIQGNDIIQVQLLGNKTVLMNNPGLAIHVPAGNYNMATITVAKTNSPVAFRANLIKNYQLSATNTSILLAGSPLTSRLTCDMRARFINLNYQLVDGQGNAYLPVDRSMTPRFTVEQNGQSVDAGVFEFG